MYYIRTKHKIQIRNKYIEIETYHTKKRNKFGTQTKRNAENCHSRCVLTVDHPSRVSISVCSMCNASTAELIRLLNCHVFPIAAVHHTVGVTISTAGRKHTTRQTRPIIIHIVQTRTL